MGFLNNLLTAVDDILNTDAVADTSPLFEYPNPDDGAGDGGLTIDKRPTFENMLKYYPGEDYAAQDVYEMVGGKVWQNYKSRMNDDVNPYANSCAIRMSRTLNYNDILIKNEPKLPGATGSGSDGKWYYYKVDPLMKFLEKTFGPYDISRKRTDSDVVTTFANKKGIIVFKVSGWKDATGHFTLWDGTNLIYATHDYFTFNEDGAFTTDIKLWLLP